MWNEKLYFWWLHIYHEMYALSHTHTAAASMLAAMVYF